MERKYELTEETINVDDKILHRIKAVRAFNNVKARDLGGFIEKEYNLSHDGDAWIYDNARVFGNAQVCGDARVSGNAMIKSRFDLCVFMYFGSVNRTTTAFKTRDKKICVKCGCFLGTLEEFRKKVKITHGDNQYAKEYLMMADLIELKLKQ